MALGDSARTNGLGNVAVPQPPAWHCSPAMPFAPAECLYAGLGSPRRTPEAAWGRRAPGLAGGAAPGAAVGAAPDRRGARGDFPMEGRGDPRSCCGRSVLMGRQRPERPVGALWERGNEIRFGKGRRKVSRERNYHHNGGKNVSREREGGILFCWHFLSVFVIWFGGKRVLDMREIILISSTQPISKVSVLITPPVLPFIL